MTLSTSANYLYRNFFWKLLEVGAVPDFLVRSRVRKGLQELIKELNGDSNVEKQQEKLSEFLAEIKTMPIAVNQSNANEQHYEVPAEFYQLVLGPCLKYSCGYWPSEGTTLEQSEKAMLEIYCKRAQLKNGKTTELCSRLTMLFTFFFNFRTSCA